jgi:hypothetical protein
MAEKFTKRTISQRDIQTINLTIQSLARKLGIGIKDLVKLIVVEEKPRRGFTSKEMAECQTAILDK